jgi:hypothetical protein
MREIFFFNTREISQLSVRLMIIERVNVLCLTEDRIIPHVPAPLGTARQSPVDIGGKGFLLPARIGLGEWRETELSGALLMLRSVQ